MQFYNILENSSNFLTLIRTVFKMLYVTKSAFSKILFYVLILKYLKISKYFKRVVTLQTQVFAIILITLTTTDKRHPFYWKIFEYISQHKHKITIKIYTATIFIYGQYYLFPQINFNLSLTFFSSFKN